ncbi:unnamed protein product [Bursaphelenchus xylophilus]|uniref:(pine wood nematode) hypothetical protein n=1 Tax=Bursaphelenchus xylophilus TaxID=6326 RepID=A0A1I7SF66_BURXY|nr:unnamed protein product [Bursaphelenchus xylophilus]CAG9130504.1 unnamed protein product [Bursaphelenchus xylophilus]
MQRRRANHLNKANAYYEDVWTDVNSFILDNVNEVLVRLQDGSLDDDIWGKIILMEKGRRIAKAYLRQPTLIVDGGDEEFDGKTLGFNYFHSSHSDHQIEEFREKIGDGVVIKMDNGNLKAMAGGSTPVIVQGLRDVMGKGNCVSESLMRSNGKLPCRSGDYNSKENNIVKIFDAKKFERFVKTIKLESEMDKQTLLGRSCVRIALVKDGHEMTKTPIWFMIINIIAVDMIKDRILEDISIPKSLPLLQPNLASPDLTQLLISAMQRQQLSQLASSSSIDLLQLASLAGSLANSNTQTPVILSKKNKRIQRSLCRKESEDSDQSDVEDSSGTSSEPSEKESCCSSSISSDGSALKSRMVLEKLHISEPKSSRPRLDTVLKLYDEQKSASVTSGYSSPQENFDMGSWSSAKTKSETFEENREFEEKHKHRPTSVADKDYSIYNWTNGAMFKGPNPGFNPIPYNFSVAFPTNRSPYPNASSFHSTPVHYPTNCVGHPKLPTSSNYLPPQLTNPTSRTITAAMRSQGDSEDSTSNKSMWLPLTGNRNKRKSLGLREKDKNNDLPPGFSTNRTRESVSPSLDYCRVCQGAGNCRCHRSQLHKVHRTFRPPSKGKVGLIGRLRRSGSIAGYMIPSLPWEQSSCSWRPVTELRGKADMVVSSGGHHLDQSNYLFFCNLIHAVTISKFLDVLIFVSIISTTFISTSHFNITTTPPVFILGTIVLIIVLSHFFGIFLDSHNFMYPMVFLTGVLMVFAMVILLIYVFLGSATDILKKMHEEQWLRTIYLEYNLDINDYAIIKILCFIILIGIMLFVAATTFVYIIFYLSFDWIRLKNNSNKQPENTTLLDSKLMYKLI